MSVLDYGIEELELGVRAYNILKRMGINTCGELLKVTGQDVRAWEDANRDAMHSRVMGYSAWEQVVRAKVYLESLT